MSSLTALLIDTIGYDPDDGRPAIADVDPRELAAGSILPARDGARAVAVARLGSGQLVVIDDVCPHDGGRLSGGFVEGDRLVCVRHGWELDVCGGRCERAPRSVH